VKMTSLVPELGVLHVAWMRKSWANCVCVDNGAQSQPPWDTITRFIGLRTCLVIGGIVGPEAERPELRVDLARDEASDPFQNLLFCVAQRCVWWNLSLPAAWWRPFQLYSAT
jgi:hypothetical protein